MQLKHIDITNAEGSVYALRLTLGGQKALRKLYGKEVLDILMDAITDGEVMAEVLQQAAHFPESPQSFQVTGEDIYNELVDSGFHGQLPWANLVVDLAECSGLIDAKQASKLHARFAAAVDAATEQMGDNPTASPEIY